eukprot:Pgem_evm1s1705
MLQRLCNACKTGDLIAAQNEIDNGVDLTAVLEEGQTPLHLAIVHNSLAVASLFMDNGVHVDTKTSDDFVTTALLPAVIHGLTAAVSLLLQRGADVNAADKYGWTAL